MLCLLYNIICYNSIKFVLPFLRINLHNTRLLFAYPILHSPHQKSWRIKKFVILKWKNVFQLFILIATISSEVRFDSVFFFLIIVVVDIYQRSFTLDYNLSNSSRESPKTPLDWIYWSLTPSTLWMKPIDHKPSELLPKLSFSQT